MIKQVSTLSRLFYRFEKENADELSSLRFNGIIIWQILKIPIYFQIIKGSAKQRGEIRKKKRKFWTLAYRFWRRILTVKKKQNLLVRSSTHCRVKENIHYHSIFHGITKNAALRNYCFLDILSENDTTIRFNDTTGLCINHVFHLAKVLKLFRKTNTNNIPLILSLHKLINDFFSKNESPFEVSVDQLEGIVSNFELEYEAFKTLYRFLKPKSLLLVDGFATASMCAAKSLGINVYEFQHGLFDEYYPHYSYPVEFKEHRDDLMLPNKIVVFGEFFKSMLIKHNFWTDNEVFVLGKSGFGKEGLDRSFNEKLVIVHPTQGDISFERSKTLIDSLIQSQEKVLKIKIKPHPQESIKNIQYFREIEDRNPERIECLSASQDILETLNEADIIMGFDSTTLLEAVALGKPTVSIVSEGYPKGILSLINNEQLDKAIVVLPNDEREISRLIFEFANYPVFRKKWKEASNMFGENLFTSNYNKNLETLVAIIDEEFVNQY